MIPTVDIRVGDWIEQLRLIPDESIQCCVTSPPYFGLRDYGVAGQFGLEKTPAEYVEKMVEGFQEIRRVLRGDGTVWLNLGDSYTSGGRKTRDPGQSKNHPALEDWDGGRADTPAGLKPKDLIGIPWRVAFALQADGWYLRQDIIWHKPNPMPESVTDRCTKAHEYIFLLTKSAKYFYDAEAIKEKCDGGNLKMSKSEVERITTARANGHNTSLGRDRKMAKSIIPDGMVKSNDSFNNAVCLPVENRNRRTVWTVATSPYSEAHFATFPPDLIKPCILAGTSPVGCCPECGAPWERVTEKTEDVQATAKGSRFDKGKTGVNGNGRVQEGERFVDVTTGWQPTCQHGEDASEVRSPVPCTVLDPFFGSGTTGQVSLELGRNCIGIELNPKYAELARKRCHVTPGLQLA